MPRLYQNTRVSKSRAGRFGAGLRRVATRDWIIFAALLAIRCSGQPAGIVYSTTIPYSVTPSGNGYGQYTIPTVTALATDASGNSYIAGAVDSNGLPATPGVVQAKYTGGTCNFGSGFSGPCPNPFVAKFTSAGALVFLTYLAGTGSNVPTGLAVDASGNIYVGGQTNAPNSPGSDNASTFVTKLSANGSAIIWSTTLAGALLQLAIAPSGSLYCLTLAGEVTAALTQLTLAGQSAATVSLPSGTQALSVGASGSVFVGGDTQGDDITPTQGAWISADNGASEGFVAEMNASLSGFAWLTFVGGNGMDSAPTDSLNLFQSASDGSIWVSGSTTESTFPVLAGAYQSQLSPVSAASGYLVHLSSDGSKALASTYLPTPIASMALDGSSNVILSQASGVFPGVQYVNFQATPGAQWPCQQPVPGDPVGAGFMGFFGEIDSAGQRLLWGTWTGPSVPIGPAAAALNGNPIVAGNVPGSNNVTLTAMTTAPGPTLVETCIAQSGSPYVASGLLAPGEIFSIYGAGFGPAQGVAAQPSGNAIATELGGVQVFVEDTPLPLLYVSSAQINLVAPYLLTGRTAAHIRIVTADATSNEVVLGVRPAAPEIFESQPGTAAILNQDGTVNSQNNPAHIGDTVAMFVSGVGQTMPAGVDGSIPQAAGDTPVLPIRVQLNFTFANITYAGSAPGLVSGASQVNFQIPQMPPYGAGPPYPAALVMDVGAASSGTITAGDGNNVASDATTLWFE